MSFECAAVKTVAKLAVSECMPNMHLEKLFRMRAYVYKQIIIFSVQMMH